MVVLHKALRCAVSFRYFILKLIQKSYVALRGGGPPEFHFSSILTSKIRHSSILPLNDPILVLKRLLALALRKFRKKIDP